MINRELIRLKVVQLVYAYYHNNDKKLEVAEKELVFSLEKAYDLYLYLLSLLVETQKVARRRENVRQKRVARTGETADEPAAEQVFAENKLILQLADNKALIDYQENRKGTWPEEDAYAKKLFNAFTENEAFRLYLKEGDFSYAADREIVRRLYKACVMNNDDIDSLIEDHCLYWNDDKDIVDSFVLKTIKRFTEESTPDTELLPPYAAEDDLEFAKVLFRQTLQRGEETRQLIRESARGWDFERLAFMDVIIMQTALAEVLAFDSIPVSVTISEYVDIAKVYSTPRSYSYVNGTVDNIVKRLRAEGRISKQ